MNKFDKYINWFVPSSAYVNQESVRLNRLFVNSCFLTALFAFGYCLMSVYVSGYCFAVAMIISAVIFLILPFGLRQGISIEILSNVFLALIAWCIFYWFIGMGESGALMWHPGLCYCLQLA